MPQDSPPPIPPEYVHLSIPPVRNPNMIPVGDGSTSLELPPKPAAPQAQTVYESKPQMRDLMKEATSKFIPAALRRRGYAPISASSVKKEADTSSKEVPAQEAVEEDPFKLLEEEEQKFKMEMEAEARHQPAVEEVEDEDA
jgi:hypothetical protein